ncbi:hypothetical protein Droror1_Dr00026052 [Drosera rotundifolia]
MEAVTVAVSVGQEEMMHQQQQQVVVFKVMVALDDSDVSFYALSWTLDHLLAVAAAGGSAAGEGDRYLVYLAYVQTPYHGHVYPVGVPAMPTTAVITSTSTMASEAVKKSQAENTASIFSRALKMCEARHVRAETVILEGDPKDMICEAVEKMQMDMLVVGSRGRGQIKRALLGSVSDYCAHHASCPVLIVKAPKQSK